MPDGCFCSSQTKKMNLIIYQFNAIPLLSCFQFLPVENVLLRCLDTQFAGMKFTI